MAKLVRVDSGRHLSFVEMVALEIQTRLLYGIDAVVSFQLLLVTCRNNVT